MISHLDEQIGRILAALEEIGQAANTVVILASDHGLAVGSHGLRGKPSMYEHTVGVPPVFAGPGVPRGERREAHVSLRDFYPTACELAGFAIPATVAGRSPARVFGGQERSVRARTFGYPMGVQRMVRGDRWKLIEYPKVARCQLFDLADDPDHAEIVAGLRVELRAWQRRVDDPLLAD